MSTVYTIEARWDALRETGFQEVDVVAGDIQSAKAAVVEYLREKRLRIVKLLWKEGEDGFLYSRVGLTVTLRIRK